MKTVVVRNISRTDSGLAARLGDAGASTVHEAQGRTGLMDRAIRPIYPGVRIGGKNRYRCAANPRPGIDRAERPVHQADSSLCLVDG